MYIAPLWLKYHIALLWKFTCSVSTIHRQQVVKRAYLKVDYSSMAEILSSIDWKKEFEGAGVKACWNSCNDKIRDTVDKFIPVLQPRRRKKLSIYIKMNVSLFVCPVCVPMPFIRLRWNFRELLCARPRRFLN